MSSRAVEGSIVQVLEEDDGSGWVKVTDRSGGKGLVPASYLEAVDDNSNDQPVQITPHPVAARQQGSGIYGEKIHRQAPGSASAKIYAP